MIIIFGKTIIISQVQENLCGCLWIVRIRITFSLMITSITILTTRSFVCDFVRVQVAISFHCLVRRFVSSTVRLYLVTTISLSLSLSLFTNFHTQKKNSGTFTVRAHALNAAFDPDYFLKKISVCEKKYSKFLSLSSSERRKRLI